MTRLGVQVLIAEPGDWFHITQPTVRGTVSLRFGETVTVQSMTHEQVEDLRSACETALKAWPEDLAAA